MSWFCSGLLLTSRVSLPSRWPQRCGQQQSLAQHHPDLASSIFLISNQKPGSFPLSPFSSFLSFLPPHCLLKSPTSYTLWCCLCVCARGPVSHFDIISTTFSFLLSQPFYIAAILTTISTFELQACVCLNVTGQLWFKCFCVDSLSLLGLYPHFQNFLVDECAWMLFLLGHCHQFMNITVDA